MSLVWQILLLNNLLDLEAKTKGKFLMIRVVVHFALTCCLWIMRLNVAAGVKMNGRLPFLMQIVCFFLIEIPLFHVLNARITFENVNSCRTAERTSQTVGSAQGDSGEEWKNAVMASLCVSACGVCRRAFTSIANNPREVRATEYSSLPLWFCQGSATLPKKGCTASYCHACLPEPLATCSQVACLHFWS